jgi:cell division protein FtsI/penicillin-binding protein 2
MRRPVLLAVASSALLAALALAGCRARSAPSEAASGAAGGAVGGAAGAATPTGGEPDLALSHAERAAPAHEEPREPEGPPMAGLDPLHVTEEDGALTAPTAEGTAHLTLDPDLQRTALQLMGARHLPEAAVVLIDVATGRLLAYASHVEHGAPRDLCAEATAPSASVFKIVTAAALVEHAHLGPDTRQCYSGGEQRITAADLIEDPQRDRWCTTLAGAMGRSINTAFARLARAHLTPPQLEAMARRFGYGQVPPFDVAVQPSSLRMPAEPLEFARTAAGFWNSTLSPLQAAQMSAIVARGGESVRATLVERVVSPAGNVVAYATDPPPAHRVIARETAEQLSAMMEHTVSEGTCWRAFHDARGAAFLPGIPVAGKTGTLTDAEAHRYYTWFTGFAPSRPQPNERQVAVAVLVVNGPTWQVKANVLARDMLRAYFAARGAPAVTRPSTSTVARHHSHQNK